MRINAKVDIICSQCFERVEGDTCGNCGTSFDLDEIQRRIDHDNIKQEIYEGVVEEQERKYGRLY